MSIDPTTAAAAAAAPAADPAAPSATDPATELAALRADAEKWKGHARTWEQRAKENAAAREEADKSKAALVELAKQLGIVEDKPDPEAVARQLAAAQAERTQLARERAVLLAAASAGADAAALLDSRSFLAAIEKIDPADTTAVTDAVKAAVEANARYKTTPAAAQAPVPAPAVRQASSPGSMSGAPGEPRQLGEADFKRMTGPELSKAMKAGLFRDYLNSPNA